MENSSSEFEQKITENAGGGDQRKLAWKTLHANIDHSRKIPELKWSIPQSRSIREPIEYFCDFFDVDLLSLITGQSNLYALQTDPQKPLQLTKPELERIFGTVLYMSLVVLPK
ncbi:Transposase IS4 [Popillia japonica]|uniref:Transposase IS4 n=1 Tax=Popillia japonica TaxID=7064 RepID=A0AAW1JGD0_POPJA